MLMQGRTHAAEKVQMDSSRRLPVSFCWRGRYYRVSGVEELWRTVGRWWDGEGERTFFRVLCTGGGILELCYDHALRRWSVHRIED